MSKILVIGATGHVGRPLIRDLIARGETVKAASRSGAPVEGAEGVAFDIAKPGEKNLTEILVDALTGAIVSEEIETPETEAKEKQEKAGKKR